MSERLYLNADCMNRKTGLPSYPDNHFDLAIVDPPFGQECNLKGGTCNTGGNGWKGNMEKLHNWNQPPTATYFKQLFRVSRHQIIWGANYFTKHLPPSMGWIFWDKMNKGFSLGDGELAFTSFNKALRIFEYARGNEKGFAPKLNDWEMHDLSMHPNQKPMGLYRWLLTNYARHGMRLLDTHVGSASSLVVFEEMGFDYVAFEKDKDYYAESTARLEKFRRQGSLFSGKEIFEASAKQTTIFDGQ